MGRFCRPRFFFGEAGGSGKRRIGALVSVFRRGGVLSVRRSEIEDEDEFFGGLRNGAKQIQTLGFTPSC